MNENLKSALRYSGIGWRVYPVWGIQTNGKCWCNGMAGCKPGKHPWGKMVPHGGKDATTDAEKLKLWFPSSAVNVGIRVENFVVLDIENRNGGMEQLAKWEAEHGKMPATPTAESGSKGRHFYFKRPAQLRTTKEKLPIVSGAELLCGGDVIVPPSNHHSGGKYSWLIQPETPLADMPDWLLSLMSAEPLKAEGLFAAARQTTAVPTPEPFNPMRGTISRGDTFADLGFVESGKRNDSVNAVIGSMLGNGFTREQILADGLRWADEQEPPYSANEMEKKVTFFARKQDAQFEELQATDPIETGEKTTPTVRHSPFAGSQALKSQPDNPTPVIQSFGLPDEAYHGILGEFVRAVEPLTEADPAGILACLLTGVGNALGRQTHHQIGRRHSANLFVLLVGNTSSRKGTCQDVAESLLATAMPEWDASCVEGGFGSGQGFVYRIRDAIGDDTGIPDKRLLVVEEEWAKPLRLCRAENSILSPLIRSAYDGKPLSVMNRGENRYGCREPHVSIVGMITGEELRELTKGRTELVNGTINRFLLVNCERRRYLPTGGDYFSEGKRFAPRLSAALNAAKTDSPLSLDGQAAEIWEGEYRRLEQQREGDYGKAVARLSVHCLKVAMVYAVLDGAKVIGLLHLKAALAFVDYCDKSAFAVFGGKPPTSPNGSSEDDDHRFPEPDHVKLLNLIKNREDGIIKRDAHGLFNNKMKAEELNGLFKLLTDSGFIVEMNGRWYLAGSFTGGGGSTVSAVFSVKSVEPAEPPNTANVRTANSEATSQSSDCSNVPKETLPDDVRSSQFARSETDKNEEPMKEASFAGSQFARSPGSLAAESDLSIPTTPNPVMPLTDAQAGESANCEQERGLL
ncbi:MAG: bifunctional DNA primase/polymerase [Planctomycetes bacterium]|nr:bifunctional DNA primase/polymerase [Planctomycetota bacterium]